jgi:ferredoxin
MTQKIVVDQNKCIGCNTCPMISPEIFEMNMETYKAQVKKQPDDMSEAGPAIASCPVSAISVEEA